MACHVFSKTAGWETLAKHEPDSLLVFMFWIPSRPSVVFYERKREVAVLY